VGGKSLVSCERKRSYHLFHAEAAILFLMWKKKKKQSISLCLSWWNQKKAIVDHLSSHSHGSNPSLSLIRENKSYVSSCVKQKKKKYQYISLSLWKSILCLMWKQKQKQSSLSLSLSLSLTCGNDPLSHVEAEEAAIISLALSLSYV
jgi:ATP-dependent helicase/DNAse subunit B